MALFSSPFPSTLLPTLSNKPHLSLKPPATPVLFPLIKKHHSLSLARSSDANGAGVVGVVEEKVETKEAEKKVEESGERLGSNGAPAAAIAVVEAPPKFKDPRWVSGTWDLTQFGKDGKTDWDAVIDAEARRRKWLEDTPEASNTDEPVLFDTSVVPWWAWMKRYHLPEAELLNGRAAMVGFFMAYFVDSLTGVGLVDQMGNFFCKTLLFIAVVGVLVIRKNEDIETVKKLLEETTFYDKQWRATWKDDTPNDLSK